MELTWSSDGTGPDPYCFLWKIILAFQRQDYTDDIICIASAVEQEKCSKHTLQVTLCSVENVLWNS